MYSKSQFIVQQLAKSFIYILRNYRNQLSMDFHSMAHTSRNKIDLKNSQTYTVKWGKKRMNRKKLMMNHPKKNHDFTNFLNRILDLCSLVSL